jgi:NAD(P)-dependent dehydrogenase (short-subunit alcohol dehydrogenase family)
MGGELAGKTCVITGAGRGIGASIAAVFASEGGRVVILDHDEASGAETAARLRGEGSDARAYAVDVRLEESVVSAAERVLADLGRVDVLVNNAGIARTGPTLTYSTADWDESLAVMQTGVFLCSREFGKVMRAGDGGAVVNISSINGLTAFPMRLAYSATKAAVMSMTQLLAVEWASYGIRVNAVAPGVTNTDMVARMVDERRIDVEAYEARIPLRRFAEPAEIAQAVLFLASDRSSYVTGQTMVVDGGCTASGWVQWEGDPER